MEGKVKAMSARLYLVALAVLLPVSLPGLVFAQPAQISYSVNLTWFSLQVTYPSEVTPGDTFNVSVQGTPKSDGVYLQNLTVSTYYADSGGLHQIASQTLISNPVNNYVYSGVPAGRFSKSFTLTVPGDVPRTSLVATFSETVQYSYSPTYYGPYPFSYWSFGNPIFYSFYPASSTATDQAISPLSYVKATTPEYVALQSEYHLLQQELNQTRTQNQQLQASITQQKAMVSQLNGQLSSANTTAQTYETATTILVVIVVLLAALSIYEIRSKQKMKSGTEVKGK
jgi:hypothetical protein